MDRGHWGPLPKDLKPQLVTKIVKRALGGNHRLDAVAWFESGLTK